MLYDKRRVLLGVRNEPGRRAGDSGAGAISRGAGRHTAGKAWIAGSAAVLLLGATSLAGAQPRQAVADVAGGSQTLWPVDREDPNVVPGWFVSVDQHRTDQMAIAYEFEHYFRDPSDTHGDTRHWFVGLAGIRYAWPGRRVTPFGAVSGASVIKCW